MIINEFIELRLKDIFAHLRYAECLTLKRSLPRTQYSAKDEYERNELDIIDAELNMKIAASNRSLYEKKKAFNELFLGYCEELEFIEKNPL
jgi:hypothetical protein